jgi:hypothetical protein
VFDIIFWDFVRAILPTFLIFEAVIIMLIIILRRI